MKKQAIKESVPVADLVLTQYHFVIPFIMPKDPRFAELSNLPLLGRIDQANVFTEDLLQEVVDYPLHLQSIYQPGQAVHKTDDGKFQINGWVFPGSKEAQFGPVILSGNTELQSGKKGLFPVQIYIPKTLLGMDFSIPIDVGNRVEEAQFVVRGLGFGASCSCCGSAKAVNFHYVAMDGQGELVSRSKPSALGVQNGVDTLFSRNGLFMMAGKETVHVIDHKIHEIMQMGAHCHQKLSFTRDSLNAGAAPAPAPRR